MRQLQSPDPFGLLRNAGTIPRADYRRAGIEASRGNRNWRPFICFPMQPRLSVRADSAAMREVKGFVAGFVSEQGIAAEDAARILILSRSCSPTSINMAIRISGTGIGRNRARAKRQPAGNRVH